SGLYAAGDMIGPGSQAFRWVAPGLPGAGVTVLPLPDGAARSNVRQISADGAGVVGAYGMQASGPDAPVRWTAAGTPELLRTLPAGLYGAMFVSSDGSVISGSYTQSTDIHFFRWTAATGVQVLGAGEVFGMSADGSVLVGTLGPLFSTTHTAFRWTLSGGI